MLTAKLSLDIPFDLAVWLKDRAAEAGLEVGAYVRMELDARWLTPRAPAPGLHELFPVPTHSSYEAVAAAPPPRGRKGRPAQ